MKVCVVGTGYVGLVAGTCFADSGNDVVCVDADVAKVASLQRGEIPIYEPGLSELVTRNRANGRLLFTSVLAEGVRQAEVIFIAVGTPQSENGEADLQHVLKVAEQIGAALQQYAVVVNKSTVPVGTGDKVAEVLRRTSKVEFDVASNPEFLKEGAALDDFLKPDRVVIGTSSERARKVLLELYAPFVRTENPVLVMDLRSAELTKYAANAMLAARISFINDMAELCDRVGADVDRVRKALGADRRIGYSFLFPGVGYGGSCFPKDVRALQATAREVGLELPLLQAVHDTNQRQRLLLLRLAQQHLGELKGRTLAMWGLAFKPKTDDLREAPAMELIPRLLEAGARLQVHDPVAMPAARKLLGERVKFCATPYDALQGADALLLVTEWNEFRHPDFERMKALMKTPTVFDGRNVFDPEKLRSLGFTYFGVGRGVRLGAR